MRKVSVSETEPLEVFLYAIRSNTTNTRYLNRLKNFFAYLRIEGDVKTQARAFVVASQEKDKSWANANVMKFFDFSQGKS